MTNGDQSGGTEVMEREAQVKTARGKEGGATRRQFFNRILAGIGGLIGVGAGVPLAGF